MTTQRSVSDASSIAWRANLHTYAEHMSGGRWKPFRHAVYAARKVQEAVLKGRARLIVCWPPRHGKSELFSHWLPTWYLDTWPERRVILTAYESTVAAEFGRQVRDEFAGNDETWTQLRQDTKAANRWNTPEGGGMLTAGIGGAIVGRGFDLGIIEDPIKNAQEATSPSIMRRNQNWFESTFYTRREPGASIVVVMHRWNERDLVGYLEREHGDDWEILRFPAIIESDQDHALDPLGREIGEPLCPERYDIEELEATKRASSSRVWRSMYQQTPSPDSGEVFRRHWFRYWGRIEGADAVLPDRFDEVLQSWDLSFKGSEDSDWVVGQVWGRRGAERFLLDQVRERAGFSDTLGLIRGLVRRYPETGAVLIEDKANGPAVIDVLRREIDGVIAVNPEGGKVSRAHACEHVFEAGQVYFPDPIAYGWVPDLVEELLAFPSGANDDQVDTVTQALVRMGSGLQLLIGRA